MDRTYLIDSPPHYIDHPSGVQCREITQYMGFPLGNAFKYVFRRERKESVEVNLEKAITYLKFEMEKRQSGSILIKKNNDTYWQIIKNCEKKLEKIVQSEMNGYGDILRSIWSVDFVLEDDVGIEALKDLIKQLKTMCRKVLK